MKRIQMILTFLLISFSASVQADSCVRLLRGQDGPHHYFEKAKRPDAKGMTSPFTENGQFIPEVAPDTLYSWMSEEKLQRRLLSSSPDSLIPETGRSFFMWRTPMGSFGYGKVSLRLRLKDGVKFIRIPHFHPHITETDFIKLKQTYDINNTVFVSEIPHAGYHEYHIYSGGPIHSMSFGTPEHLAEMKGEGDWILAHDRYQDFDLIIKEDPPTVFDLKTPVEFDYAIWSRDGIREKIHLMEEIVSSSREQT